MKIEALGFQLLYATERVDEKVLSTLFELSKDADVLRKMKEMQEGVIINRIEGVESENRSVLHTATRDFFEERMTAPLAKKAADLAKKEYDKLAVFMEKIHKNGSYTDIIQVGIGGSDLGPRALTTALERFHKPGRKAHFISNVDPDDSISVLNRVDLKKTLIVVVSKSGETLETLTNEAFIRDRLKKMSLDPKKHIISVTGKGSPMDDPSRYLASFYIWDYIGGRYSVTSMVGGVTLSFVLGMEGYHKVLWGAHQMDRHAFMAKEEENLPLLSALLGIWNRNFLHLPTVAIIPYSQALSRFTAHLQQCDMESNGKHIDSFGKEVEFETGPIIWGEPGTNGQHSFYQMIHQGTTTVPLEFIGFKTSQFGCDLKVKETTSQQKLLANLFAQSIALAVGQKSDNPNKTFYGNRPSRILLTSHLDPETMGKLLAFYEHKVAFQGFIWGINSFDQEGVQLGKVLAGKIIDLFAGKGEFPLGSAYLSLL